MLEFNGDATGINVSIAEALASDDWDYVTLQQASPLSFDYSSYQPYLNELADYVRMYVPKAKILIHQTWAYEQGSERLNKMAGFDNSQTMLDRIKAAYNLAAEEIQVDGIIPCGEAMMRVLDKGIDKIHRDAFHADLGLGRYLLALVWYMTITDNKAEHSFDDFDIPVDKAKTEIIKSVAEEIYLKLH